jgi:hypothetical protein
VRFELELIEIKKLLLVTNPVVSVEGCPELPIHNENGLNLVTSWMDEDAENRGKLVHDFYSFINHKA